MATYILEGVHSLTSGEEFHLIHYGHDGAKWEQAAAQAQASGKYANGRLRGNVIYTFRPFASVPVNIAPAGASIIEESSKVRAVKQRILAPAN